MSSGNHHQKFHPSQRQPQLLSGLFQQYFITLFIQQRIHGFRKGFQGLRVLFANSLYQLCNTTLYIPATQPQLIANFIESAILYTKESSKNNFPILNSVFLMIAVEHLNMWKLFTDNS